MKAWEKEHGHAPNSMDWRKSERGVYPSSRHVAIMFGRWIDAITEYEEWKERTRKRWRLWSPLEIIEAFQRWNMEEGRPPRHADVSHGDHGGRLPSITSINSQFPGGFREALEASGFTPLPIGVTHKGLEKFRPLPRRGES
jgi:hypothetical protein